MKTNHILVLASLFSVSLGTSCGLTKTKDKGKKGEENAPELAGKWGSNCYSSDILGLSKTQRSYAFNAVGDFDKTEKFYAKDSCNDAVVTYTVRGTYDVKGKSEEDSSLKKINFTVNKAEVEVNSKAGVDALNTVDLCGISDWKVGKKEDITGKDCATFSVKKGDVVFEVYKLNKNEDRLKLGESFVFGFADDADERPTETNDDVVYSKN